MEDHHNQTGSLDYQTSATESPEQDPEVLENDALERRVKMMQKLVLLVMLDRMTVKRLQGGDVMDKHEENARMLDPDRFKIAKDMSVTCLVVQ